MYKYVLLCSIEERKTDLVKTFKNTASIESSKSSGNVLDVSHDQTAIGMFH